MRFRDSIAVLQIRDYRYFLSARFLATLGMQMQVLVISWQIYERTKDPFMLGLIGGVEAVVFICAALWAGHFADRHEKRAIIVSAETVLLLCSVGLWFVTLHPSASLLWAYALIAVTGLARSFLWPASFSYSELTVPKAIYSRAATLNSTGWEIASITGPALGGILYAWKGPAVTYGLIISLLFGAVCCASFLGKRPAVHQPPKDPNDGLLSGARFVLSKPLMLGAMSLDMFAVLFSNVYAILPVFADRMGVGAPGLGYLRAAPSIGAILMAMIIASRPPFQKAGQTLLNAVAVYGVCILGFAWAGYTNAFVWALVMLGLSGMADNISVVIRASIMQAETPDHMRGRVSSINGMFIGSSNEIGAFRAGAAAKLFGTIPSVVFGGAMTLLTVALVTWKVPALRRLGTIHNSHH
ncbi:MAG: MFS transporter [Gammaproteobacteria bacterium]|nr:MAG: MFS transporter [Gammaproteobacteria bacterium]